MSDQPAKINKDYAIIPFTFILLYLLFHLVKYFGFAWTIVSYPYEINSGEGLIVERALLLSQGRNVYSPIAQEPYLVMNYTPMFELVLAGFTKLFGPKILWGRMISVFSTLLCGIFIMGIVRNHTKKVLSSVIAGMIFFTSHWLKCWSVLCRTDMFALMFVLAGLFFMTDTDKRSETKNIVLSAVCLMAGLFTRQSMIAAPLSIMLILWLPQKWKGIPPDNFPQEDGAKNELKALIRFSVIFIAGSLLMVGILSLLSKGEFFRHTFTYTIGFYEFGDYIKWLKDFWKEHWIAVTLSTIFMVLHVFLRRMTIPLIFWVLSFLVTITAGKLGSSINYFLEFWSANCIVLGICLAFVERMDNHGIRNGIVKICIVALICAQLAILKKSSDLNIGTPTLDYKKASAEIKQLVVEEEGEVLSEYTGYLVQNNRKVIFQPFTMSQLSERGLWDQSKFIKDISDQRFELIVITGVGIEYDRWTSEMLDAINKYYVVKNELPCYELSYYISTINTHLIYRKRDGVD